MKISMTIFIGCIASVGCNPSSLSSVKVIDSIWQRNDVIALALPL